MAENRTNMIDDETLEKIAGGDLSGFQATLLAGIVIECKKKGMTLEETIEMVREAFRKSQSENKTTDYYEAIGLVYEMWHVS